MLTIPLAESEIVILTVNFPAPHKEFCTNSKELEVEFMPALTALATTFVLFDITKLKLYGGVPPLALAVMTWLSPNAMGFNPAEMELKAKAGFTAKETELEYAFCKELSVTITFAYKSPSAFALHISETEEFELAIVLALIIELAEP